MSKERVYAMVRRIVCSSVTPASRVEYKVQLLRLFLHKNVRTGNPIAERILAKVKIKGENLRRLSRSARRGRAGDNTGRSNTRHFAYLRLRRGGGGGYRPLFSNQRTRAAVREFFVLPAAGNKVKSFI